MLCPIAICLLSSLIVISDGGLLFSGGRRKEGWIPGRRGGRLELGGAEGGKTGRDVVA